MSFDQQQILQRLSAMKGIQDQTTAQSEEQDLDALYSEAVELIRQVGPWPDEGTLDELEEFWGLALEGFGEEWEEILDFVLDEAEVARLEGRSYNHNGYMYFYVLERCYEVLKEEESPLPRGLFKECLSCLRATRTLQESLAREASEKSSFSNPI